MQTFIKEIQKFKGGTVEDRIAHFYCSSIEWHLTWQLVAHQWCYYLVVDWEQDWILLDWTWNGKLKLSCWDRKKTMTREPEGIHSQRQIECAKFLKKEKPGYLATLSRHWILSCFKFNWQTGRLVQGYQNQIRKQTDAYLTHRQRGMMMMMSLSLPRLYLSLYLLWQYQVVIWGQNTHLPQKSLNVTPYKLEILLLVTQTVIREFIKERGDAVINLSLSVARF